MMVTIINKWGIRDFGCRLLLTWLPLALCPSDVEGSDVGLVKKHPNVLLILVDDLRPAIGAYGDPVALTPHIDQLAARAIRFDRAYSNQAVCAPSRYNLMLGSRSTSTGIYDFGRDFRDYYPDAVTLPQYFKQHGYHTESMGKVFHIGHNTYDDTASWSVPHHKDLVIEYVDPASKAAGTTREEALFSNMEWGYSRSLPRGLAWESPDVADDAYADGRIANRAVERLRALKSQSEGAFFLAVGFARPHLPFSVPKKYWDMYDENTLPLPQHVARPEGAPPYAVKYGDEIDQYAPVPAKVTEEPFPDSLARKLIHGYYAGVSYVDAQIGKVLDELAALGLDENTIVVLWGDHGYLLGEMGMWTKHVNYELANHIPLVISAPGVTRAGSHTDQLTETVDIYPTLVELAGLPAPDVGQPIDGISMVPVLNDPESQIRDHVYHCFPRGGYLGRAIRTDRYRMVAWKKIGDPAASPEYELYDYRDNHLELKNIAGQHPEIVAKLCAILARHPGATPPRPQRPRRD
ncbi:iduronate 2-sulfatase [Parapedobacter composti]|uniref:Iduronate 2-sulfatase n=1 Tax=Parapedobacter composti TaxID=623281 RepID=A0A1I1EZV6_9SPHI|nr:sulfatase [Parapedobacter composti]SFB90443.1 iduronate 2-sulfatase [Parapedobacter composti]